MNPIINALSQIKEYKEYIKDVEEKRLPITLYGLTDIQKTQIIYSIFATKKTVCIILNNEIVAQQYYNQFLEYNIANVYYLPKREISIYDYDSGSLENSMERANVFSKLLTNKVNVLITTIESIIQPVVDKNIFKNNIYILKTGEEVKFNVLIENLINSGYARADMTENKGQFSVRGGIIDIFPSNMDTPIRVEFWGDEVDNIKTFDVLSQRSIENINSVEIYPCNEYVLNISKEKIIKNIRKLNIDNLSSKDKLKIEENIEEISNGNIENKIDKYYSCIYEKHNFLEYIPDDMIVYLDEPERIEQKVYSINFEMTEIIKELKDKQRFIPQFISNIYTYQEIISLCNNKLIYLNRLSKDINITKDEYVFNCKQLNTLSNSIDILIKEIQDKYEKKYAVILLIKNKHKAIDLSKILDENKIKNKYIEDINSIGNLDKSCVYITVGSSNISYEYTDIKLAVLTDNDESSGRERKIYRSAAFKNAAKVVLADLSANDYVVHVKYGIGQFIEINTLNVNDIKKDYLKIKYKDDDVLYIPTDQLDNVRKYVALNDGVPKLNKLGSKEWQKARNKAKENTEIIAKELVELYAERQKVKGFACLPDSQWQKEFELDFPYQETDDQLRCISEVKADMEKSTPMDRLLCGDVGYGKTEVAIRAAFKSVMSGKQVAYLVPTTVLAMQQYDLFKERMQKYDIRVGVLSRFKSKKEQENVVKQMKLGTIDIVIGTHRLLQKDIAFKDLGLLIIDEEHRFGVKHKETIKQLRKNIDVLSMTATPIPRTLHMSIVGIRDMSVIYDPPHIRKPVQTYVLEYDKFVIRDAIVKELERKGQVFYIFNSVNNIEDKLVELKKLVPEARIEFAHGQMSSTKLENIMYDFVQGDIDVLICTTILESGIDIQNANTIIIENADRMGLAQLYQIRGRVGRKDKQAYAYITYKRNKLISETAQKRLKAIREFTEFGSGFKIALRDLEIRGAGNILGSEQHGNMEAVGYEMYCKLLEDAVKKLQGKKVEELENDVQIDLKVSAYIPEKYISNQSQKIEVYQSIALCETFDDVKSVSDEIVDRYGELSKEVNNLLEISKIKIMAKTIGISSVIQKGNKVKFEIAENNNIDDKKMANLIKKYNLEIKVNQSDIIKIIKVNEVKNMLENIQAFLKMLI